MSKRSTREEEFVNAALCPSRRVFTKAIAAAVLSAPVMAASAQTPPAKSEPKAPPNPQPTPTPAQPPPPSPLAVAYTEIARLRFGEQLNAEQLESVKRDLEGNVRTAERLRGFKLKNSDEPDFVFGA